MIDLPRLCSLARSNKLIAFVFGNGEIAFCRNKCLWFAKVVFARDAIDELLDDAIEDSESAFVIVLLVARGCVGLVRWILWGFMVAAYTASSTFSRQMEFDADRYEIALVGSDVFISTGEELHRLSYASENSMQAVAGLMQKAVLIDNIPKMI